MFSVVIPLYNKRDYIETAIRSAATQAFPPREIIVVDDGSSDGSYEIVEKIQVEGLRLIKTGEARSGPSKARNIGIEAADAEWIAFLDADDSWELGHLAKARDHIEAAGGNCACVFSAWNMDFGSRVEPSRIATELTAPLVMDFQTFIKIWLRLKWCPMWTSAVVVSRDLFRKAGGFPEAVRRGEDKVAWFRIMQQGTGIYSPEPLALYNLDIPNQETKSFVNGKHALCTEIDAFKNPGIVEDRDLRRLYNLQVIVNLKSMLFKERISREAMAGFAPYLDPFFYAVMLFSHHMPLPLQRLTGRLVGR